jgi:hypothetical protein
MPGAIVQTVNGRMLLCALGDDGKIYPCTMDPVTGNLHTDAVISSTASSFDVTDRPNRELGKVRLYAPDGSTLVDPRARTWHLDPAADSTNVANFPADQLVHATNLDIAVSALRDAITKTGATSKTLADVVAALSEVEVKNDVGNPIPVSGTVAVTDSVPLSTSDSATDQLSTINTSDTALNANATFTPTGWDDLISFAAVTINLFGKPELAKGTLTFQFTDDTADPDIPVSVPINVDDLNVFVPFTLVKVRRYFRVLYTNGSTNQTKLRLRVMMHRFWPGELTRTLTQTIGPAEPIKVVRSLVEPSIVGERGLLGADREVFGAAIVHSRISQISVDFSDALANNRVTSTVTGTGATAQANGQATISTGTGATSSARLQSIKTTSYRPMREMYAGFTVRFTVPTSAASEQRAGIYDDNNGFFLGYHGLIFGFTIRSGGVDTFTPLTSANGDPLDGTYLSRYARGGVLEAYNPAMLNVWRIRFGWLGSSVQFFDLQSPDGLWMRVHSNRFPNLQTTPSIQNPDLPMRMEAIKTGADATNLVIGTGSWDAGVVAAPNTFTPSEVNGREHVDANTSVAGSASATNTLMYTVNIGRILKVLTLQLSAVNVVTTGGEIQLTDGSGGTIRWRVQISPSTGTNKPETLSEVTLSEPLPFSTAVYLVAPILGVGGSASAVVVGYEEAA